MIVIFFECAHVLRITVAGLADGRDAHPHAVTTGMGGIPLKITMQGTVLLGNGQFIIRPGEMVHADIYISLHDEIVDRLLQNTEFFISPGQIMRAYLALCFEYMRQVCIVVNSETIR